VLTIILIIRNESAFPDDLDVIIYYIVNACPNLVRLCRLLDPVMRELVQDKFSEDTNARLTEALTRLEDLAYSDDDFMDIDSFVQSDTISLMSRTEPLQLLATFSGNISRPRDQDIEDIGCDYKRSKSLGLDCDC
jgi:hypothetical protein